MKTFTLVIIIICNGFVFGQNIPVSTATPTIPKTIEIVHEATVCHDYPDHEAYFPNGNEAFTKNVEDAIILDSVKIKKNENILKAILSFTVEKDGNITETQIIGSNKSFNNSIEKAIKRIKGKWIPEKLNGNVVRSKLQIPININFK
ncbi:energy transducer TonB [Chryseobacterium sp. Ch-15]|uniref:Energy transducer TonB n=1 Tax=Chryseobacterium muglaense TaxID=2893752 RepID=A0A9Q3UXA1_9FLAO|nr:energy transducer TonB [Chryseobacterium muglaense]MBD3904957.1 energy transducer TonB [Chryseobacterium muglaense]MCC9035176.1 energy transducer TonB [Chryseobacterium muglaense]MCM2554675.1 energy transducer TonB [Chryseobacterium muglaense]